LRPGQYGSRDEENGELNRDSRAKRDFGDRMKAWPERIKTFYNDVRTEMKKVTAPSFKEVQATTTVVIITVFLFAVYFWAVDLAIRTTAWSDVSLFLAPLERERKKRLNAGYEV
jgi:preprotein translocase SecE subunit